LQISFSDIVVFLLSFLNLLTNAAAAAAAGQGI